MKDLITLVLCLCAFTAVGQKPNIIIFIGDDMGWNDFGCYGNTAVKTPNIDKMAKKGLQFQNAFLTASSCSPSRISILNARYPHNTGAPELHMPIRSDLPNLPGLLKANGYYTVSAGKWHQGATMRPFFDTVHTEKNGNGGENNWVRSLSERPKDKPFFMWFAAHDAHRGWGDNDYSGSNSWEKVKVPPYLANTTITKKDLAQYHDEISRFDAFVGKVERQLQAENLLKNTIIIIMADNGRPFPRCKTRLFDDGIKTPFIVRYDGVIPNGSQTESMISAIDIAPTLLSYADIEKPETFQGKSFRTVLENPSTPFRNHTFAEHNWHDYESYGRMVRTKDFLYIYNGRPQYPQSTSADNHRADAFQELVKVWRAGKLTTLQMDNFRAPRSFEELYDLRKDPSQFHNLSGEASYQETLKEMRQIREEWQQQTGDSEPSHLSISNHDWLTGYGYKNFRTQDIRGEVPGAIHKAHQINHPGKF